MNKIVKKILFFFFILNIYLLILSGNVFARTQSTDIDAIDDSLYPGIKEQIKALQASYPNWVFKVEYTDLEWDEVLNGEHQDHGAVNNPANLVTNTNSNSYGGLWICEICGTEKCDSGSWYCASKEAIAYMMDPRNSLNSSDVFQFMQLSSSDDANNDTVRNVLRSMGNTTNYIDDECIEAIITAANTYNVDPYYIMAKIIEEQGTKETTLIAGRGYNGNYVGYYNFFNIGATSNTGTSAGVIQNGLAYAAAQNWNTKTASIVGGIRIIAQNYIAKNQDTLYFQKFNVVGNNIYAHQYQQNVLGAQYAGTQLLKLYKKIDGSLSGNYNFIIPLYKNMPAQKAPRPATNQTRTIDSIKMGDVNSDNQINVIDVVIMINYLNGKANLEGNNLSAAKVTRGNSVTVLDVVLLINYLNGNAVLPNSVYHTGTINTDTTVRLSPNGTIYANFKNETSIRIISLAGSAVDGVYWDLVVSSKGVYGYIDRNTYSE